MTAMLRQGDVLLVRVEAVPPGTTEEHGDGRMVLAEGEATGHAHVAQGAATLLHDRHRDPGRFLRVDGPTTLVHEEHPALTVPVGDWRVIRQREYSPRRYRRVSD